MRTKCADAERSRAGSFQVVERLDCCDILVGLAVELVDIYTGDLRIMVLVRCKGDIPVIVTLSNRLNELLPVSASPTR